MFQTYVAYMIQSYGNEILIIKDWEEFNQTEKWIWTWCQNDLIRVNDKIILSSDSIRYLVHWIKMSVHIKTEHFEFKRTQAQNSTRERNEFTPQMSV